MRSLSQVSLLRLACAFAISACLTFGLIGCGGSSAPPTGTVGKLPPEAEQANKNMEDFVKNQQKK